MSKNKVLLSFMAFSIAILSCNLPLGQGLTAGSPLDGTGTATSTVTPGELTLTPTSSPTATVIVPTATNCPATIKANSPVNVRTGPGTVYPSIDAIDTGVVASVIGRNNAGTWWNINRPTGSGTGWVAGSVVTATCIPVTLAIVADPPTPLPASGTCKDDYVWRKIRSSDKVCVPPASKLQADADNAAAASRKATSTYGPNTCVSGYVWREAYTGDVVCVIPATRSQAAIDNAAAASRVDPGGAYGPNTCVAGFVWREANSSDVVCVTPAIRTQTAADNAAAASHVVGPDDCIAGYVWRGAFSGDKVCVTLAVRTQTAADNAAAPSHTW